MATTDMNDLLSVITDIEVTPDEILNAELLWSQILSDKFPDLDLREGTAIRDLTIRPGATIAAMLNKAMYTMLQNNNVRSMTDETSTDQVDKLLSNWFLERKTGQKAVVSARLYFAVRASVVLPSTASFSTDNVNRFRPLTSIVISKDSLILDNSSTQTLYYTNVDLVAEDEGAQFNISFGSLLYFSVFNPYFLRGEINYLVQQAIDTESNTQFISRAKTAISTRNLINYDSVDARLREAFPSVNRVSTVGFSDVGMRRDLVSLNVPHSYAPILTHLGGKVDVYAETPTYSSRYDLLLDAQGNGSVTGPIYHIERFRDSEGAVSDTDTVSNGAVVDYALANTVARECFSYSFNPTTNMATFYVPGHMVEPGTHFFVRGFNESNVNTVFVCTSITDNTITGTNYTTNWLEASVSSNGAYVYYPEPSRDYGLSTFSVINVSCGIANANKTITLNLYYYDMLDDIQTWFNRDDNRVICADYLVRGLNIYELDITIRSYETFVDPDVDVSRLTNAYLASINVGDPFVMSDFISALAVGKVHNIQTPVDVTFKKYSSSVSSIPFGGTITTKLIPHEKNSVFKLKTVTLVTA